MYNSSHQCKIEAGRKQKHKGYLVNNKLCWALPGVNFQTRRQKKLSFGILKKWLHTKGNKVNVKYRNHKLTQLYNLCNPSYAYYIFFTG